MFRRLQVWWEWYTCQSFLIEHFTMMFIKWSCRLLHWNPKRPNTKRWVSKHKQYPLAVCMQLWLGFHPLQCMNNSFDTPASIVLLNNCNMNLKGYEAYCSITLLWCPQQLSLCTIFHRFQPLPQLFSEFVSPLSHPRLAFSSEHYLSDLTATPLILHTPEAVTSLPPSQELNTQ